MKFKISKEIYAKKATTKMRYINKVPHVVQVAVLLFVLVVPILSLYQSYVAAHAIEWMQETEKAFFTNIDNVVRNFTSDPETDLDVVKGSVWSTQFGSLKISDPLAMFGQLFAEKRFYLPFVLTILIPVVVHDASR